MDITLTSLILPTSLANTELLSHLPLPCPPPCHGCCGIRRCLSLHVLPKAFQKPSPKPLGEFMDGGWH